MHLFTSEEQGYLGRSFHMTETQPDGTYQTQYGLLMEEGEHLVLLPDLSCRRERVTRLIERLSFHDVSRYHLLDILEDTFF
mgnify:CR=1 FL=1